MLSWSFTKHSSAEFVVCESWTCYKECEHCEGYAVPCVWRLLFNYILSRASMTPNFKYSEPIFTRSRSKQVSCRLHVAKTAKLFSFFHWLTQCDYTIFTNLSLLLMTFCRKLVSKLEEKGMIYFVCTYIAIVFPWLETAFTKHFTLFQFQGQLLYEGRLLIFIKAVG